MHGCDKRELAVGKGVNASIAPISVDDSCLFCVAVILMLLQAMDYVFN